MESKGDEVTIVLLKKRTRYLLGGAIIGIVVGFILLGLMHYCTSSFEISGDGGYTSDKVMICLLLLPPTLLITPHVENIFFYFTLFSIINGLIGVFVGWTAYRFLNKKKNKV